MKTLRLFSVFSVLVFFALVGSVRSASAADGSGGTLAFSPAEAITVEFNEHGVASFTVALHNLTGKSMNAELSLVEISLKDGALMPGDSFVVNLSELSPELLQEDAIVWTKIAPNPRLKVSLLVNDLRYIRVQIQLTSNDFAQETLAAKLQAISKYGDTQKSVTLVPRESELIAFWAKIKVKLLSVIAIAAEILVALLAFAVIFRLLGLRFSAEPRLQIEDFDSTVVGSGIGANMTARMRQYLTELQASNTAAIPLVHLVSVPNNTLPIENLEFKVAGVSIKVIGQFYDWLLKPRVLVLTGRLQKAYKRGVGISLKLQDENGEVLFEDTLWQARFDPLLTKDSEDKLAFEHLIRPAVMWTIFHYGSAIYADKASEPRLWESWACYFAGLDWFGQDLKVAHQMLSMANETHKRYGDLEEMWPALINMAFVESELAPDVGEEFYELALENLARARVYVGQDKPNHEMLEDGAWFKAVYTEAAIYDYQADLAEGDAKSKLLESGKKTIALLVDNVKELLNSPTSTKSSTVRDYLKRIGQTAVLLWFYYQAKTGKEIPNNYNNIAKAVAMKINEVLGIEMLKGKQQVDFYKLNYQGRYELAIYLTLIAGIKKEEGYFDHALIHLEAAFMRGGNLVSWAQQDPSLSLLREKRDKKFLDLVKRYEYQKVTPVNVPQSVNEFPGITAQHNTSLEAKGIFTANDLLVAAQTRIQRDALSKSTGIPAKAILRWANLADLMRVHGVSAKLAELLEIVGVDSPVELATRIPKTLHAKLKTNNDKFQLVTSKDIPDETQVEVLVKVAKQLKQLVFH